MLSITVCIAKLSALTTTQRTENAEEEVTVREMSDDHDQFSGAENLVIDDGESVSPPHTPLSTGIRLIPDKEDPDYAGSNGTGSGPAQNPSSSSNSRKRKRISMMSPMNGVNGSISPDGGSAGGNSLGGGAPFGDLGELLTGSMIDSYRFIEKFNRDMMDQFMEYQKKVAANQSRWEAERRRQDQMAIEQWRQEAREHDRQMFGIFCSALTHCNAALNVLLRAKQDAVANSGLARTSDSSMEQSTSNVGGSTSRKTSKGLMTPTDQSSMHSSADDKSPSSKEEGDPNCSS